MDNKSILVAVDFGATSARAFTAAVDLAARLGAPLDIVTVIPPIPLEAADNARNTPDAEAAFGDLAQWAEIAEKRGVAARTHLRTETVVFGLLEAITELEPQLVVVGSHGRRGVTRVLLGSVSESLARRSKVPIVIVPSPDRSRAAMVAAWSCGECGHILADRDARAVCARCGVSPARWISAAISDEPADAGEPSVGESVVSDLQSVQTGYAGGGSGFFATSPAGGNDRTVPNAELRVRY